ncbi:hypothetical protein [Flavobacterium sp.]|uniref:hypothetical protein n=1 Tax=Flavobacterium sp. TaxID=239 RepID=UPI0037532358
MKNLFRIKAIRIDETEDAKFEVCFSNGISKSSLEFYSDEDVFKSFAQSLRDFPKDIHDKITFEIGKDDDKWAYYLSVKVFCVEPNGKSIFRILIDNHGDIVNGYRSEFSLNFEVAEINKLGESLSRWKIIEGEEWKWPE